jgi:hypothetical protein
VTVRVQVVFEGETMESVVAAVRRWLDTAPEAGAATESSDEARRESELREVLGAIRGAESRRFVLELAQAAVKGEGIPFDHLKDRYGKSFSGVVGGPNKLMRRIARRDLISRDALADGYRMDPRDARIVRDIWSQPGAAVPESRRGGTGGEDGGQTAAGGRAPWP